MIPYHRIAQCLYGRPLLLLPSAAETVSAVLLAHMAAKGGFGSEENDAGVTKQAFRSVERPDGSAEIHAPRASRFYGDYPLDEASGRPLPFRRTAEGIGIITVVGELVNRGAYVGASSGLISYEGIKWQLAKAAADPKTRAIVLDMETPGGEAVGAFEAATAVRDAAAKKPVVAVVNGMSASAGYALASAATRVVTMPTGLCGSIGVVLLHLDFSAYLQKEGVKPTLIFAGAHKVDGNPYEALPQAVRKELQAEVESFYSQFIDTVALGRKALSAAAIRATEARIYKGEDAVAAGLADEVGTFEEVLADLSRGAIRPSSTPKGTLMENREAPVAAESATISEADHKAAIAKAAADATAAATARVGAILGAKEAVGREGLAQHLATKTQMSAEDAIAALAAAPAVLESKPLKPSRLDALVPDPKVTEAGTSGADDLAAGLNAAVDRLVQARAN